jgi:hypothetical protein
MGRAYAVQCRHPGFVPWAGFEFVFSPLPNIVALADRLDLVDQVDWLFWVAPIHVFVKTDGTLEPDKDRLRLVRQSLTEAKKDRIWINLRKAGADVLDAVYSSDEWPLRIRQCAVAAREQAELQLRERLEPQLLERRNVWENMLQQARSKGTAAAIREADALELMLRAINEWTVHLEGAGFLAVNDDLARMA